MKKPAVFLSGCVLTAALMSALPAFAETQAKIDVYFGRIKLMVNGAAVTGKETLLYNGTTYVPLRDSAEILGKDVSYDSATQTAYINDKRNVVFYEKYPTVPTFDSATGAKLDKITDEMYQGTATDAQVAEYKAALVAKGFVAQSTAGIEVPEDYPRTVLGVYAKDNVKVTLANDDGTFTLSIEK